MLKLRIENILDKGVENMRYKLKDICIEITDGSHFSPKGIDDGYPMFSVKDMEEFGFNYANCKYISKEDFEIMKKNGCVPQKGDVLVAKDGSYMKEIFVCEESKEEAVLSSIAIFRPNINIVQPEFLCFLLKTPYVYNYIKNNCVSGSALPRIVLKTFKDVVLDIPNLDIQSKITKICSSINHKIRLNNDINDNLHFQLISYYKELFCNDTSRKVCKAEEYFDITIGKTPPRKEQQWFSENPKDVKWFSIADMGKSGLFISDSSEYLTEEAIKKYNVVVVPENTLILSFKLTVGRVAITTQKCTTNEAIAHFKAKNKDINPYLYCYLKNFKYSELGSTSSIATAINSKIVKAMPFIIPNDDELLKFNLLALPILSKIKSNEYENQKLSTLRDTLLPKLMSGEIDVSNIKLDL